MKIFRQLGIILIISFLGEFISSFFNLPIPGSIIGMIILFICLCTKIIKLDMINEISKFLIDHLAFFFIPVGVGLISSLNLLEGKWMLIILISLISTVLVIFTTGFTVQLLKRRCEK
ncbi:CidA/LrgA family protein [Tepidibacter formicigenes]|uniref:Holin-like protein n=1 Tax=Tepidibacter formicigenes DSM 15518 TaxID=1123349 RepID=A0A1M6LN96_9FIRM|nr:CidA/LrgA family protein [Tepidibacter formicigenes]SHJ72635.1 holin-like protein [Tepidibacter formicigenes DSM 15518]